MAKGFGKLKVKKPTFKKPNLLSSRSTKGEFQKVEEGNTPRSSPTPTNDVLKPVEDAPTADDGAATPAELAAAAAAANTASAPELGGEDQVINTEADEVLEGILQDLNIKIGQVAVVAQKCDTVSEYSGGSAKSIESEEEDSDDDDDDDEDSNDDEETDDEETDEGETDDDDEEPEQGKKKKKSVGDRFSKVMAAAEEIRKKKRAASPESTTATPHTEPGSHSNPPAIATASEGPSTTLEQELPKQSSASKSVSGSKAGRSKADSKSSSKSPQKKKNNGRKSPAKSSSSKSGRKSPIKSGITPKKPSKKRSKTPEFSAELKSQPSATQDNKSIADDELTKETRSESTPSYDEGTLGSNTLGSDGMTYGDNTFDEEESNFGDSMGGTRTKKTVMNKDVITHQPGGPSGLVVRAMYYTPLPASPEDIIVKVEASTVSFRDCLLRRGIGAEKASFPFVPGCEVVGTISNAGKAARHEGYRVGDRVVGMTRRGGGNGYYAKLNISTVAPILSTSIDASDAVCLVDVYMTAYQALRVGKKDGTPLTDANVLVTDGFSPVGQAVVALAKLEGANVYVTTTESRQDEYMKSLGVKCLPLAPSKWLHKLRGKMDIVIDNTCSDNYESSWKALAPNGALVCTGMTSLYSFKDYASGAADGGCGCDAFGDIRDYQAKWAAIKAKYMMSQTTFHDLWDSFHKDPKKYQQELKYLCFLVESGTLKPKIAERVSIEEVPDAQRYLETGKANGTIVCLP